VLGILKEGMKPAFATSHADGDMCMALVMWHPICSPSADLVVARRVRSWCDWP
jgi:hypothetical protein